MLPANWYPLRCECDRCGVRSESVVKNHIQPTLKEPTT